VQAAEALKARGAAVIAISGDSPFVHAAFKRERALPFPLLSDVHRAVIRAYDVLDEDRNVAYRSTFIVDRDGVLRWGQAGDRQMTRDGAEVLRVLDVIARLRARG
jgi:alkyl hydroperoxide reductase subunit AhpC